MKLFKLRTFGHDCDDYMNKINKRKLNKHKFMENTKQNRTKGKIHQKSNESQ